MSTSLDIVSTGKLLHVRVEGTLTKASYEAFTPLAEKLIAEHGKIRVLFEMHDFHGWTAGALWEDLKFDYKHFGDIEKLAIVGETKWQEGMATFCKPFTSAAIKYFDDAEVDEAQRWVMED
ncbi:MAG: STAS/SEC14 domain-containing protein [Planctomycetales bacterium]|nr:STAS/SEC14 domain-containing protein [Planctomycetales bacterium]